MDRLLIASHSISINSSPESIWNVMTNPEKVKIYLFGTNISTDWKIGSPIKFTGEYNGQTYEDKGHVLEIKPNELIRYNYWSGF